MPFAEWSEEYEIGVQEVDDQHQQLFEILNEFYESMNSGSGRESVGETIQELEEYVDYHFDSERELAIDCGFSHDCSGCHAAHQQAHEEFTEQVSELRELYEEGDATVHIKTLRFLRKWLKEHIDGMDQQLGQYVNETVDPAELEPLSMNAGLDD